TIGTKPGDPSSEASPQFDFTSTEPDSTFECSTDGGAWSPCASPWAPDPLADGTHTVDVRAVDLAGNADPTPDSWTWLVDTTPPPTSRDEPPPNLRGTVTPSGPADDADGSAAAQVTFQYSVAGANTWQPVAVVGTPPYSTPLDTTTLPDGLYDFRTVAI